MTNLPGHIPFLDPEFRQIKRAVEAAGFIELTNCRSQRSAIFLLVEFPFFAKPHEQDAIRLDTDNAVKQQAGAGLALHVATTQDVAEKLVGRAVEDLRGRGKLPRFEDADYHASTALLFRATAFYAKFQNTLLGD